jgi:hypothetical protein
MRPCFHRVLQNPLPARKTEFGVWHCDKDRASFQLKLSVSMCAAGFEMRAREPAPHHPRGDCVHFVYKKAGLKGLKLDLSNAESTTDS